MERTIWKTELRAADVQDIEVPIGAELLTAREQNEKICVWYRCNPDPGRPKEFRRVAIVGTGHPCPVDGRLLGIASLYGGSLIFHVFEQ